MRPFPLTSFWMDSSPCVHLAQISLSPYLKSMDIYQCSSDSNPLDFPKAMGVIGMPPPCAGSPDVKLMSYVPNFALIDWGYPSNFFPPVPERGVKKLSQVDYPTETSTFYDGAHTLPDAYFQIMDIPVQARHHGLVNASFVDGHAKAVRAQPFTDATGKQIGGHAPDGHSILYWTVTSPGPYQGKHELLFALVGWHLFGASSASSRPDLPVHPGMYNLRQELQKGMAAKQNANSSNEKRSAP
jgi:hypothetical protein